MSPGGGVRVAQDSFAAIGWSLDLLFEHGSTRTTMGEVTIDTLTTGAGLYAYRRWPFIVAQLGAGLRMGIAKIAGNPDSPLASRGASAFAPWGWPDVTAELRFEPHGSLVFALGAEAGYVALPVSGTVRGVREVTVSGPWFAGQLSLGFKL